MNSPYRCGKCKMNLHAVQVRDLRTTKAVASCTCCGVSVVLAADTFEQAARQACAEVSRESFGALAKAYAAADERHRQNRAKRYGV